MKQVATMTGPLLDYWTARADGRQARILAPVVLGASSPPAHEMAGAVCYATAPEHPNRFEPFQPSTMWLDCGKLIDDHAIGFEPISDAEWMAEGFISGYTGRGPTPQIAACRAFIASIYGEDVPDEVT